MNEEKYRDAFKEDLEESLNSNERSNRKEDKGIGEDKHGGEHSEQGVEDDEKYKTFNGFKFRYGPNDPTSSKDNNNDQDDKEEKSRENQKKKPKKERKKIFPEDTDGDSGSSPDPSSSKPKPSSSSSTSPEGGANFGVSDFTNGHLGSSSGSSGSNGGAGGGVSFNSGETGGHKIQHGEKEEGGTAPHPFEPEEKLSYHPTKLPLSPQQQRFYGSNEDEEDRAKMLHQKHEDPSLSNHEIKELSSTSQKEKHQQDQQHDNGESRDFSKQSNGFNVDKITDDDLEAFNQGRHHHHVKGFSDNHATFRIHSKKDLQLNQSLLSKKSDASSER